MWTIKKLHQSTEGIHSESTVTVNTIIIIISTTNLMKLAFCIHSAQCEINQQSRETR